jgi:hypothetical protein
MSRTVRRMRSKLVCKSLLLIVFSYLSAMSRPVHPALM